MDKIAGSGNDEFYTPYYAIEPILKYLKPNSLIWCPFDTEDSLFVKVLSNHGHRVDYSHIENGENFFEITSPDCDYIISNPPYSMKNEVFERLFELKKPFAMLVGVVGIFESQRRFHLFKNNIFEIMYMNKRVAYFQDFLEAKPSKNPPFSSVYITSNILPEKIMFEEVDNKQYLYLPKIDTVHN